jgi:hypothetical protein
MTESNAVLTGVFVSLVLTPLLVAGWRKADPPDESSRVELTPEAKKSCAAIERESIWAIFGFFVLLCAAWGWSSPLKGLAAVVFISGLMAVPYLWTVCRCTLAGPQRTKEYVSYYQSKHKVGIKLASVVGITSTYVMVVSLVIYELWLR